MEKVKELQKVAVDWMIRTVCALECVVDDDVVSPAFPN